MCFSAQASFLAGTGLTTFGIYLLKQPHKKTDRYFFAIPLMFGIQQLCEGVVWISQMNPELAAYNIPARYSFLFFALVVWPTWIPFSILKMETNNKKGRCLASLLGAGALISTMLAWIALTQGVASSISCNHIQYILDVPKYLLTPSLIWYWMATIGPFFVTNRKYMKEFGVLLLGSAIVALYFYNEWFTSVWCFFAAILSLMIYRIQKN